MFTFWFFFFFEETVIEELINWLSPCPFRWQLTKLISCLSWPQNSVQTWACRWRWWKTNIYRNHHPKYGQSSGTQPFRLCDQKQADQRMIDTVTQSQPSAGTISRWDTNGNSNESKINNSTVFNSYKIGIFYAKIISVIMFSLRFEND